MFLAFKTPFTPKRSCKRCLIHNGSNCGQRRLDQDDAVTQFSCAVIAAHRSMGASQQQVDVTAITLFGHQGLPVGDRQRLKFSLD